MTGRLRLTALHFARRPIMTLSMGIALFLLLTAAPARGEEVGFTRGDIDGNGVIDQRDVELAIEWYFGIAPVPVIESLDVLDDGVVDIADVNAILMMADGLTKYRFPPEKLEFRRGDLNEDGRVTPKDVEMLKDYLGQDGAIAAPMDAADLNGDGMIDVKDLQILERDATVK